MSDETVDRRRAFFKQAVLTGVAILCAGVLIWSAARRPADAHTTELDEDIPSEVVNVEAVSRELLEATAEFSLNLFEEIYSADKNTLISPPSIYFALGMTTNGAAGDTRTQMEQALGDGASIDSINRAYQMLGESLSLQNEDGKFSLANSIWIKSGLSVKPEFLKKIGMFYGAEIHSAGFDEKTVREINDWVFENTDGLITKMLDTLDPQSRVVLLNTVLLDAKWAVPYIQDALYEGDFYLSDGGVSTVSFMRSSENRYLETENATGFVKPYRDGKFSFVALLPNQGVTPQELLLSLSGKEFISLLEHQSRETVQAALPKFSFEYGAALRDPLMSMGMVDAFDGNETANFSNLSDTPLFIDNVIHKAYIQVDELGTKAGAATSIAMNQSSLVIGDPKVVTLDRPFLFAVVDNQTNLPLFLGVLQNPVE